MAKKRIIPNDMDEQMIKAKCEQLYINIIDACERSGIDVTLQMVELMRAYNSRQKQFEKHMFDLDDLYKAIDEL